MRRAHWLSHNLRSESVHSIVWVDTETDTHLRDDGVTEHRLRFGWAAYQRTRLAGDWTAPDWRRFDRISEYWDWIETLCRGKTRLHMFAHNWSFDAAVLDIFGQLKARGWRLKTAIIDSPPVILVWRRGNSSIRLLDTLNWWRMPLAKIGDSIGLPKLDMPSTDASSEEWDTYAKRDVEVIRRAIMEWLTFLQTYDLGGFGPTLASQAFRAFRHRFMDHQILIDDDAESLQLARASLHGGRTEAFRIGRIKGPIYGLDVNSMYPAVMLESLFPARLALHCRRVELSELDKWSRESCVIARCSIETKRNRYAHVAGGKLAFPTGRMITTLTTPDIRDAIDHDEIRTVEEASVYDPAPIFRKFVHEIYQLRQDAARDGATVQSWLLKILMNSLYGKFAQRGEVWMPVCQTEDESVAVWAELDLETNTVRRFRRLAGLVQERTREQEAQDSHPAIAAHVTAYARAKLWDLIQLARPENVFYCDTDSLYVNNDGQNRLTPLIDQKRIGALKQECVLPWLEIYGAKDYRAPDKIVCKGVRTKATWLSPNRVEQEQWTTLNGLLRAGQVTAPLTQLIVKDLRRVYTKGTVGADGMVLPLSLADW